MTVALESTVRRSEDLVHAEVDGEATLMHVDTGRYFGLTEVATRIWQLMEAPIRVDELCRRLVEEYEVSPERCREEVLALLERMAGPDLVVTSAD